MGSTALRPLNWNNEAPPFDSNLVLLKIKAEEDAQLMLAIFSFFFFLNKNTQLIFAVTILIGIFIYMRKWKELTRKF